jgi:hypothetical protein
MPPAGACAILPSGGCKRGDVQAMPREPALSEWDRHLLRCMLAGWSLAQIAALQRSTPERVRGRLYCVLRRLAVCGGRLPVPANRR